MRPPPDPTPIRAGSMAVGRIGRKRLRLMMDEIQTVMCQGCHNDFPSGVMTHVGGQMCCPLCSVTAQSGAKFDGPAVIQRLHDHV